MGRLPLLLATALLLLVGAVTAGSASVSARRCIGGERGCRVCSPGNARCRRCVTGYGLSGRSRTCKKCVAKHCAKCHISRGLNRCQECVAGYRLDKKTRRCKQLPWTVLIGGQNVTDSLAVASMDPSSGALTFLAASNASGFGSNFMAWDQSARSVRHVFAANFLYGQPGTGVTAFRIGVDYKGKPAVHAAPSSFRPGKDYGFITVSPGGRWVLAVGAGTNVTVSVSRIRRTRGGGVVLGRPKLVPQEWLSGQKVNGTGCHQVVFDPSMRYAYLPCYKNDFVRFFKWNEARGELTPLIKPGGAPDANLVRLPTGSLPRHAAFHPTLPILFVINEGASTVAQFKWNRKNGQLVQPNFTAQPWRLISTLPPGSGIQPNSSEIAVTRDGRFLYAGNRGNAGDPSSIAIFSVNPINGTLTPVDWFELPAFPRQFSFTPDLQQRHMLVGVELSASVWAVRRNKVTGKLRKVSEVSTLSAVSMPAFVSVVPVGSRA